MTLSKFKRILRWLFIAIAVVAIIDSCLSHYFKYAEKREVAEKGYFPVQDNDGNHVDIFEFERYLENRGAKRIIKGFYYKENGNTAICYDFLRDDVRYVLDNEIVSDEFAEEMYVRSRLSAYHDDATYRTEYQSGGSCMMDYRSPMWVDMGIYDVLRGIFDREEDGECPFKGIGVEHYEEDSYGNITMHWD